MKTTLLLLAGALCLLTAPALLAQPRRDDPSADVTQGALRVTSREGRVVECPLRHTDVQATISGFVARVKVAQDFVNPWDEPIEAVYVFPLSHSGAVDDMTMVVGTRRIVGVIKRRAEARAVYEQALAEGRTASLLEQERPNVFTQSVGNIPPHGKVRIEISYVDVLAYDRGAYEFHFPMVVGPRYVPGTPLAGPSSGDGWAPDTTRVPDASRVTPPVLRPGERTGHDIVLSVRLEAGVGVRDVRVVSHEARVERLGASRATATLSPADAIPNKDFVLRYAVAGEKPELALLAHAPRGEDGYFLLMVEPREMQQELRSAPPREICFLVDVSGSMSGLPTAKVVETMRLLLGKIRPEDRLQVVTFASETEKLFPGYVPATPANVARALRFTDGLTGRGGTEMLRGIQAVLADPVASEHVRIVVMLTDGFIGNEAEIIREVARRSGDQIRFWGVGVGTSVNRYLIDGVGKQGGMSAVLGLAENPAPLVAKIADRLGRAQLGHVDIDWGGQAVYETYPAVIPDLWAGSPIVVVGRYRSNGPGTIRVSGRAEGQSVSFPLSVSFPGAADDHAVLAKVWARRKIEDLSGHTAEAGDDLAEEITELSLRYRLLSAYTSFVAVDESEEARLRGALQPPWRMPVPVPLPEGVRYEGVFGETSRFEETLIAEGHHEKAARNAMAFSAKRALAPRSPAAPPPPAALHALGYVSAVEAIEGVDLGVEGGVPGGVAGGVLGGVVGGLLDGSADARLASPPRPARAAWPGDGAARRHPEAKEALAAGRDLLSKEDLTGARRALRRAWLLERTVVETGSVYDTTQGGIAAAWADLEKRHEAHALKSFRALGEKLDLVVRNAELEDALAALAKASKVAVHVVPGSFADAAESQRRASLRVAYLDLRGATVAQALTWLTAPLGLDWRADRDSVVVTSSRRLPTRSVWVYEASGLVAGDADEMRKTEERLRGAVRADVVILDPEHVLVDGDAAAHARAAAALGGGASESERREGARPADLARAADAMRDSSWALLAASLRGETDDRAVAELLEAWRTPGLVEGMSALSLTLPARTAWTIARARAALPADEALRALAGEAFGVLEQALRKRSSDAAKAETFAAQVFLALLRNEPDRPADLVPLLPSADAVRARPAPAGLAAVAASLLGGGSAATVLSALEEGSIRGDDWTVLAALGLRQEGGDTWRRFRASKADLLAGAAVSGAALRVINRLEAARLPEPAAPAAPRKASAREPVRMLPMVLACGGTGTVLFVAYCRQRARRRRAQLPE
jgi:Ca-activated chloride channel family protein